MERLRLTLFDSQARGVLAPRDDDVLAPVHDRDVPVGVPHSEVARVEVSSAEGLARRLGVLEVLLHDDVPAEDNLAHCLAVLGHIDERRVRALPLLEWVDDPRLLGGGEGDALPRDKLGALFEGKGVPFGLYVAFR